VDTSIKNTVERAGLEAQYDAHAKSLLGHKEILAWILAKATDEFPGMKPTEIIPLIEGEPEIGTVPVDPGSTNAEVGVNPDGSKIIGLNTENKEAAEGTIHFDILFKVRTPDGLSEIIINIEPQMNLPTLYNILNRGGFYSGRLVSSQKLGTLLSKTMPTSSKENVLENEYAIQMKEEVYEMSNLAEGIWEEGFEKSRTEIIHNMYRNHFTLEQIALATQESVDKVQDILKQASGPVTV